MHVHTYSPKSERTPFSEEYNWVRCDACGEWSVEHATPMLDLVDRVMARSSCLDTFDPLYNENLLDELPRQKVPVEEYHPPMLGLMVAVAFDAVLALVALLIWRCI
jgi:hypothetical protein